MSWVKATDKYSKGWQLCRIIGDINKFPAYFASNVIADYASTTYRKDKIEWLDTEEPSFSINDMKDAYNSGANNWYSFEGFMKKYFKIDITK